MLHCRSRGGACSSRCRVVQRVSSVRRDRGREVGSIVALRGPVDVGRAGAWMPAVSGMPVQLGDEVRTGAGDGRA